MLVTTGKDSLLSVKLQLGYRPCAMFFNLYHSLATSAEDKLIFFGGGGGGGGGGGRGGGENRHGHSMLRRKICMKCQIYFLGKIRNILKCHLLIFFYPAC